MSIIRSHMTLLSYSSGAMESSTSKRTSSSRSVMSFDIPSDDSGDEDVFTEETTLNHGSQEQLLNPERTSVWNMSLKSRVRVSLPLPLTELAIFILLTICFLLNFQKYSQYPCTGYMFLSFKYDCYSSNLDIGFRNITGLSTSWDACQDLMPYINAYIMQNSRYHL